MFDDGDRGSEGPGFLCAEVGPDSVAAWAARCVMPEGLGTQFGELDPAVLSAQGRVDALVALERLRCWVDHQQQLVLAAMAAVEDADPLGKDFVSCEVACALRIPAGYAQARLDTAAELVGRFPAALEALRAGNISLLHARILVEAAAGLDEATAAGLEGAVLPRAVHQTAGLFRRSVNRARARLAPQQAEEHAEARAGRRVEPRPLSDGMGQFTAAVSAEDLAAVWEVISGDARELTAAGDDRTMDELRADCLVDRILGRTPEHPTGVGGASVQVTVALSTLTGLDDQPGELAGYGPIPASMARRIAAQPDSVWRRLVTDELGRLLDYGRTTYRPPAGLADFVRAWDQRCVFPTCARRAKDCDIDHLTAWRDDGQTDFENLAAECPRHHQVKHDADWTVARLPDGTVRWTSPTGHTYHRPLDPLPVDRTIELITSDPDPPPF